ncbi:MAG: LacI family DNA-binding transcriptional regulator [Micromonosporaceae bacterium]
MPAKRPVTREDVARYAQVSAAVVSYVVNKGPKRVRPATEARVLDAIRVLGYRPNAAARALKLRSPEMIGLVLAAGGNALFVELANYIQDYAKDEGFALILANSRGSVHKEREHLRTLAARQLDGVLLASVMYEPDVGDLTRLGVPVLLLDSTGAQPGAPSIGTDLQAGAELAVRHLIGHGHRDIGLILGAKEGSSGDGREQGWLKALGDAGLAEGPTFRAPANRLAGYQAGQRMLKSGRVPTALFVGSDAQAIGVLRALHEAGLKIPQDIAMVSFDGSAEAEYAWPALTTVRQPIPQMARDAVDHLLRKSGDGQATHRSYQTELLVRQSCGCTPAADRPGSD